AAGLGGSARRAGDRSGNDGLPRRGGRRRLADRTRPPARRGGRPMSPGPARDATVLVTGATGGVGPGVVAAFLDDGWRVVATSRSGRPPQDLVGHDRLESVATDLFEPAAVTGAVTVAGGGPG